MRRTSIRVIAFLVFSLSALALKAQIKVSFTTSSDTGCSPFAETFVNTSTGLTSPYVLTWSFGDGKTATGASASHTYTSGTYKATLHVKDGTGSTDSASKTITVIAKPKPNLGPDQRGCWGHVIMLTTGLKHIDRK